MCPQSKMASEKTETPYLAGPNAIDISPEKDEGVLKEIVVVGIGEESPSNGCTVKVHYTGTLTDGTKFDSSVDRREPFEFNLGKGEVIKAWDIGVATMKKGERCFLTCKSEYAYGKAGSPPKIPPNSTLIFEVELLSWEMEDISPNKDHGIQRSIITAGEGYMSPNEGSCVEVHMIGRLNDRIFEERDVKFEIGEGSEMNVVEGVELALQEFKKGEKSKVLIAPKYAYGSIGHPGLQIPPDTAVEYELTLINFEKEKEAWNMTSEEKIEQAEIVKTKGTNYFKSEKYELASKQYQKVVNYLQFENTGGNKEKKDALLVAGYLNIAACSLKLERYDDVISKCDDALQIDPGNSKGSFRKGQAHLAMKEYETAKECFLKVLETDKDNKAALKNVYLCKDYIKKQTEREKKMYQAMFQKMAKDRDEEPSKNKENGEKTTDEKMTVPEEVQA